MRTACDRWQGRHVPEQLRRRAIRRQASQRCVSFRGSQLKSVRPSSSIRLDMRRKRINHVPRLTPLFFAAFVMLSSPALSNDGQITLVVGFAAGGTSSTAARILAESIEHMTRSSTVVENRPGAGGAIAADWVLRQRGTQTLLFMSSTSSLKTSPQSGTRARRSFGDLLIRCRHKKRFSCEFLLNI